MDTAPVDSSRIDKQTLVQTLLSTLEHDLGAMSASQQATLAGATHEESRPENDKDTRALESSYLARGLAGRVEELQQDVTKVSAMRLRAFHEDQPIALSALVVLRDDAGVARYLLAPAGGGKRLTVEGQEVQVVTPASPVGRALIGKRLDDDVDLATPAGTHEWSIDDVY